jgi:hypothetical protein
MKLSNQDVQYLSTALSTLATCGIDSIIIEEGKIRGRTENNTCIFISDFNVPSFPQKVGLTRLSSLSSRLSIFGSNVVIDAKESSRGEISSLEISGGRNKVQFRCTSTMLVKAPKAVNDPPQFRIFIKKDELKTILDAIRVMGAKRIVMSIRDDQSVGFDLADSNNDTFNVLLETKCENLGDEDYPVHYYPHDVFVPVMKAALGESDLLSIEVGQAGTIRTKLNGHQVILFPQIDTDGEEGDD